MDERVCLTDFEQRLARDLARYAHEAVDPRPSAIVAETAMRPHALSGGRAGVTRRRWLTVLAFAAAILLPVGVWLAGGSPRDSSVPPFPSPSAASTGTYQAIFVRPDQPSQLVAVRSDGQERPLGSIPVVGLPAGMSPSGAFVVSPTGQLAFKVTGASSHAWAFVDLRASAEPMHVVGIPWWGGWPSGPLGVWGAEGTFAASASEYHDLIYAIDVATATTHDIPGADIRSVDDWSFAAAQIGPNGKLFWGGSLTSAWLVPGAAAASGTTRYQSLGARRLTPDGSMLSLCDTTIPQTCTTTAPDDGSIITVDADGHLLVPYREKSPAERLMDVSFSADDASIWLLHISLDGGHLAVLRHIDSWGGSKGPILRQVVLRSTGTDRGAIGIRGIAPDDSLIAVWAVDFGGTASTILMPTTSDAAVSTYHDGLFAGFLPSSVADALPGGSFTPLAYPTGPDLSVPPAATAAPLP